MGIGAAYHFSQRQTNYGFAGDFEKYLAAGRFDANGDVGELLWGIEYGADSDSDRHGRLDHHVINPWLSAAR